MKNQFLQWIAGCCISPVTYAISLCIRTQNLTIQSTQSAVNALTFGKGGKILASYCLIFSCEGWSDVRICDVFPRFLATVTPLTMISTGEPEPMISPLVFFSPLKYMGL